MHQKDWMRQITIMEVPKSQEWMAPVTKSRTAPVTVQAVDVAEKIWGKDIAALKGKTTRSKPHVVARDSVKIPRELMKLHKEVFLTDNKQMSMSRKLSDESES